MKNLKQMKRKLEKQIKSQKAFMDKFVTNIKLRTTKNLGENITNEQEIHQKDSQKVIKLYKNII